jgi:hypothetical protein
MKKLSNAAEMGDCGPASLKKFRRPSLWCYVPAYTRYSMAMPRVRASPAYFLGSSRGKFFLNDSSFSSFSSLFEGPAYMS